jgi:hypothetical protein
LHYLTAGAEILALGENALVVVDVVLPAVLGPRNSQHQCYWGLWSLASILVLVRKAGVVAYMITSGQWIRGDGDNERARANWRFIEPSREKASSRMNVPAVTELAIGLVTGSCAC